MRSWTSKGISEAEKAVVTVACQRFIDEVLKPRFLPVVQPTEFNYPIDIYGKWHGARFRFIQRYRSGFPDRINDEFDSPFVALDWVDRDRFDVQWYRHTGTWHCLYRGLSLTEALNAIETDPVLHPL